MVVGIAPAMAPQANLRDVLSGSPGVQVEQLPESAEITLREQAYAAVERRQRE